MVSQRTYLRGSGKKRSDLRTDDESRDTAVDWRITTVNHTAAYEHDVDVYTGRRFPGGARTRVVGTYDAYDKQCVYSSRVGTLAAHRAVQVTGELTRAGARRARRD